MKYFSGFLLVLLFISGSSVAQNFTKIDAATYNATTDTYYFFSDNYYLRKKLGKPVEGPFSMSNWEGWDKLGWERVGAVVYNEDTETYYFFHGHLYSRKKKGESMESPRSIVENWDNYPKGYVDKLQPNRRWRDGWPPDAVIYSSELKRYYFFKGNRVAIKPSGKPFAPIHIPTILKRDDFDYYVRVDDAEKEGLAERLFEEHLPLLDAAAQKYLGKEADEVSYEKKTFVYPKFAENWPRRWKFMSYSNKVREGKVSEYGIKRIAAALFNSDTQKWYFFVNNYSAKKIGYVSWERGEVSGKLRFVQDSGFSDGWPD